MADDARDPESLHKQRQQFASTFDVAALKKAWRARCREVEEKTQGRVSIDPLRGITDLQRSTLDSDELRETHNQRMAERVYESARRRPLNFDNGHGEIDMIKVSERALPTWWQVSYFWHYGKSTRPRPFRNTPYDEIQSDGELNRPLEQEVIRRVYESALEVEAERFRLKVSAKLNRRYREDADREFAEALIEVLYEEREREQARRVNTLADVG